MAGGEEHGRIECRALWLVDSQEMTAYLDEELDWLSVHLSGRIRRSRRPLGLTEWESRETHTRLTSLSADQAGGQAWISSLSSEQVTATQVAQRLRGYWAVENGVFRVRDVSYDEDRLHGRKIGYCLSILRNVAILPTVRQAIPSARPVCRQAGRIPLHT